MRISNAAGTLALLAALASFGAAARNPLTSLHPEELYSNDIAPLASPGEFAPFIVRVQEKLKQLGFDAGPANGDFGTKTQAALAQYQIANTLPASGQLDDETLKSLGVSRYEKPEDSAAAGGTGGPAASQ